MGHLAVDDLERRAGTPQALQPCRCRLAGAQSDPLRVWLGPWSIDGEPGDVPDRLNAADSDIAMR